MNARAGHYSCTLYSRAAIRYWLFQASPLISLRVALDGLPLYEPAALKMAMRFPSIPTSLQHYRRWRLPWHGQLAKSSAIYRFIYFSPHATMPSTPHGRHGSPRYQQLLNAYIIYRTLCWPIDGTIYLRFFLAF